MKKILIFTALILVTLPTSRAADISVFRTFDEEGFSQIVYEQNGQEKTITNDKWPHADPITNGQKIVWTAQVGSLWQLFYYDIYADKAIQLTNEGNNVNHQFEEDILIWEGQRGGVWQILMFDGIKVTRLTTSSFPSQNAQIKDSIVTYSQKDAQGSWKVYMFDIANRKTVNLSPETTGINPTISGDEITWQAYDEEAGKTYFYTLNTETGEKHYEELKRGRKTEGDDFIERIRNLAETRKREKEEREEKNKPRAYVPLVIDPEDIEEELDLDVEDPDIQVEETTNDEDAPQTVEEILELYETEETSESTSSN